MVDDLGRLGRVWREADVENTDLETIITDLLDGQYKNPFGIFCFDPAEGCSRDVSEEVARELRRRCELEDREIPAGLAELIERHEGRRPPAYLSASLSMKCSRCDGTGWVCEAHIMRPWEGPSACGCGAPGAPCGRCNNPGDDEMPRPPKGFKTEIISEWWATSNRNGGRDHSGMVGDIERNQHKASRFVFDAHNAARVAYGRSKA